jgi:hypothetical protein
LEYNLSRATLDRFDWNELSDTTMTVPATAVACGNPPLANRPMNSARRMKNDERDYRDRLATLSPRRPRAGHLTPFRAVPAKRRPDARLVPQLSAR